MNERMFSPRGVVVVGASTRPGKLGYAVAKNMIESGYSGKLHLVNPKGGEVFGIPIHTSVAAVPDPADLAVILIPASYIPQALEDIGQRGIPYAIIGSGGFSETGAEGKALEDACLVIARQYNIRVIGPNCVGYIDTHEPINTSFLPVPSPLPGDIAFISQSGAICDIVIDWTRGLGYGLSRLLSIGNQMDLKESDFLAPTAQDPYTRVIAMYLEGVDNGDVFVREASQVAREKPIVVLKVGRSEAGRAAVSSHTGALAGADTAYEAAFNKAGVLRAKTTEEMFDWSRALAWAPLPAGRRMAILTNAGGPGAITTDALVDEGLQLAQFSSQTKKTLQSHLPAAASINNPVDMLAQAGPETFSECLQALLDDDGVDGVLVILPPPPVSTAEAIAAAMVPVIKAAKKPVLASFMGEEMMQEAVRIFTEARIPEFHFPERAASALGVMYRRSCLLARPLEEVQRLDNIDVDSARRVIGAGKRGADGFLDQAAANEIARAYGLPLPLEKIVKTSAEAVRAAQEMGYPVVMKVLSADIPHKSDIGGIALGIDSDNAALQAFKQVTEQPLQAVPQAKLEGVLIQPMLSEGQEVIVGGVRDPQFGPLLMFGSGGVEVEALGDVAFELTPVTPAEADRMLERTWAGRRMKGFRGAPASDREAVQDIIARIGTLMDDLPEIMEVEINPVRVFPGSKGVLAIDVRIRIA